MAADGVAGRLDLPENFRRPHGVLADLEEQRPCTIGLECRQHGRRIVWPRAIVEGEHDLAGLQEVVLLEMLEAEARSASGVDLDHAGNAQRVRMTRTSGWNRRGGGRSEERRVGKECRSRWSP